ncbi:2-oxoacid:acceptor oxidoreductase subunit alpha [Microbacter margulisiae]|uniref:2-oxoglutarate ferredoxin oxidoreductase subunit alpha n=1 Tax=Microbacter margulisiae TaxID=1350067 RepID=A0A7W5DSN2_9PORP|nr:2-oxoacid:acceptor oxidoreductase subunit alpha [Microbacter margulisiae]MBB3188018.1 2-oxoglutarate ferredoxin oxidoreductase subunit alpha [Microbacter margulisiae]
MTKSNKIIELEHVVIRFSGDSGDGMQLTGTLFSNLSAILGNEISTFPDYPAEIRAPQGTLGGVSGFQVHLGSEKVMTPGDKVDVLVSMNPAALKMNAKEVKPGGVIIYDENAFTASGLQKAAFKTDNPFSELELLDIQLLGIPLTDMTKRSMEGIAVDNKLGLRSKNMFALGLICWLFNRPIEKAQEFLMKKFSKKPEVLRANIKALVDGFNYGNNLHVAVSTYRIVKSHIEKGRYTSINGNKAVAYGLMAAAQKAGLQLFLGSYPITPASDIMHELTARKDLGVRVIQSEDEIAGISTAIGASFAGNLAVTSTSGPGLALKSEAIGLAVMAELPLVIVDVQRGGPSTGLPTKTEQADLLQALYGRNGESPLVVMAASTPDNCFNYAYMAAKIAVEHVTPVILLTDGFIANGTALWKLPSLSNFPEIVAPRAPMSADEWSPYMRDSEKLNRYWMVPGTEGFMHRIGGLEKNDVSGEISTDPMNHQKMVDLRRAKIEKIADYIPDLSIYGDQNADVLLVGWGSTYGHLSTAVDELIDAGKRVALAHFNYIMPLPKNTYDVLSHYSKIIVCELNGGQFASYLRSQLEGLTFQQYNKVQGQPFEVDELMAFVSGLC